MVVADEVGWLQLRDEFGRNGQAATEFAGRARGFALPLHRHVETGQVDRQPAFACDVLGEIKRKPVGIVEAERVGTGDGAAGFRRDIVEDLHAGIERLREAPPRPATPSRPVRAWR